MDKLAITVPYVDKGNIARWKSVKGDGSDTGGGGVEQRAEFERERSVPYFDAGVGDVHVLADDGGIGDDWAGVRTLNRDWRTELRVRAADGRHGGDDCAEPGGCDERRRGSERDGRGGGRDGGESTALQYTGATLPARPATPIRCGR